jgi:hypothetical protein
VDTDRVSPISQTVGKRGRDADAGSGGAKRGRDRTAAPPLLLDPDDIPIARRERPQPGKAGARRPGGSDSEMGEEVLESASVPVRPGPAGRVFDTVCGVVLARGNANCQNPLSCTVHAPDTKRLVPRSRPFDELLDIYLASRKTGDRRNPLAAAAASAIAASQATRRGHAHVVAAAAADQVVPEELLGASESQRPTRVR